ncbi:MAG: B12-binding domain-containing radical SAM protein [Syntrophobacteraceae bacterium]
MRILLLEHPREASEAHFNDIANTPLWSCLMTGYTGAALVRAGFAVDIVDAARWTSAQTVQWLVDKPSLDVLAVHAVYSWEATESLFQMLADLRSHGFDAPICLYGFFPGLVWKEILDYAAAVDYVIVGEPEETMVDLARCIEAGIEAHVEGVALRSHGKASFPRTRAPIESPDRLAFPLRPSLGSEQTVSILASRGCYNHCSFCLVPVLDQGKTMWRGRSPQNVAAEISELVSLGKKDFYFVDPNFVGPGNAGKQTAAKLASRLAGLGITFGMETRANDVTYGLMRELVGAGLTRLLLGIESGRPDVLKRLGKHASIAGNEKAIATIREAGLEPEIGFIMFDAASTLDDIRENLKFLQRNRLVDRLGRTANLLYHDHVAFKGTPGYQSALQRKMLVPRGLFGFEGLLLYRDFRVGWLAGLMKRICHFLLKEMGKPSSPVYWVEESARNEPYRATNDHLVEIFERLLGFAEKLNCQPDANWTQALLSRLMDELRKTFMGICVQHVHKKQVESPEEVYGNYEGGHRPC